MIPRDLYIIFVQNYGNSLQNMRTSCKHNTNVLSPYKVVNVGKQFTHPAATTFIFSRVSGNLMDVSPIFTFLLVLVS